jgi:NAD(P)-dependent dehydrogenase (short-subunit alcohol dehydrogenase family)
VTPDAGPGVVVITGASSGIGRATAGLFARPVGGKARCGQAGRSKILQPALIGVAAAASPRSNPFE